jgi:hypothetical protein
MGNGGEVVTIRCLYSCDLCGLEKVEAEVPARTFEGIIDWTERVLGGALSADHARRSPLCHATSLARVYVPVKGTDRIGAAPDS